MDRTTTNVPVEKRELLLKLATLDEQIQILSKRQNNTNNTKQWNSGLQTTSNVPSDSVRINEGLCKTNVLGDKSNRLSILQDKRQVTISGVEKVEKENYKLKQFVEEYRLKIQNQELFILDLLKQLEEKDRLIEKLSGNILTPKKTDPKIHDLIEPRNSEGRRKTKNKMTKSLTKNKENSPKRHTINFNKMTLCKSPIVTTNTNNSTPLSEGPLPAASIETIPDLSGICYSPRKEELLINSKNKKIITESTNRNTKPAKKEINEEKGDIKETQDEILSLIVRDHEWIIYYKDLHFGMKLGHGVSSTVYKGTWKNKEEIVAIKVMKLISPAKDLNDFKKELSIISQIRDPNIVLFYGFILEPKFCIVMELCENGSLYHYLKMKPDITWDKVFKWSTEATRGLNILHLWKPAIVHRDLKSLNLLLDKELNIKVCDFGLSRYFAGEDFSDPDQTLQKLRGTYAYTAPEMYYSKHYTPKSDIYSLGIIIWEIIMCLLTGKHQKPYSEYTDIKHDYQIIFQVAQIKKRPSISPLCPKPFEEIIEQCWAQDSNSRPTAAGLLESLRDARKIYKKRKTRWYHPILQNQVRTNNE